VPLVVVSVLLLGLVLLAAAGTAPRLELLRTLVIGLTLSELTAQGMKRMARQPRPLSMIPGLDMHDYPTDPLGNAYPSAHTAMVVAAVSALWPWMRWPQRILALVFAILVACNRLYIGAHWPIGVVGGAAIGLLAGAISWLVAARWPIHAHSKPTRAVRAIWMRFCLRHASRRTPTNSSRVTRDPPTKPIR